MHSSTATPPTLPPPPPPPAPVPPAAAHTHTTGETHYHHHHHHHPLPATTSTSSSQPATHKIASGVFCDDSGRLVLFVALSHQVTLGSCRNEDGRLSHLVHHRLLLQESLLHPHPEVVLKQLCTRDLGLPPLAHLAPAHPRSNDRDGTTLLVERTTCNKPFPSRLRANIESAGGRACKNQP
jgi:hypothetical protein